MHPLVLELTGKRTPHSGLEGKFSVYHACAAALIHGRAGEGEFSDRCVNDARVVALRERVHARADDAVAEASADVTITTRDGRSLHKRVEHALGSVERPMTDEDLEQKFRGLVEPVLGKVAGDTLIALCREVPRAENVRALVAAARPTRRRYSPRLRPHAAALLAVPRFLLVPLRGAEFLFEPLLLAPLLVVVAPHHFAAASVAREHPARDEQVIGEPI